VRHHTEYSSAVRGHTCDIFERTVRIAWQVEMLADRAAFVPKRDCPILVQTSERCFVCIVLPFTVRDWQRERLDSHEPWAASIYLEVDPSAEKSAGIVGDERPGEESRAREYLKTVADADGKRVALEEFLDVCLEMLAHTARVRFPRTCIVAIGKSPGHSEYLRSLQDCGPR
jgi:hypothetical protein